MDWQPIKTAPFMRWLEVKNNLMDEPVIAARGYVYNGFVHPNTEYFSDRFGRLVKADVWRDVSE